MKELKNKAVDSREKYWNEDYVRYWKARVEEANKGNEQTSQIIVGDVKTTTDSLYINAIKFLEVSKADRVLELACGFGRSLPVLCGLAAEVFAVDISEQMIQVAKEACKEKNISFYVSPSEKMPFPNHTFDIIVCFAAFDAMYQKETLIEMNRVSKAGARILVTGKNDNYFDDDQAAIEAEVGARSKKHPNYFTDVKKLLQHIEDFGFSVEIQKYYLRRGDFVNEIGYNEMPEKFYEYLLVLKKIGESGASADIAISRDISKTYDRQN